MRFHQFISSLLKIGAIGFGGGNALVPIFENELVMRRKALKPDELAKHSVVANITPGALPVKLAATCGFHLAGSATSVFGAYSVALPGTLFTVLIIALFSTLGQPAVDAISYAGVGITVYIVHILIKYIVKTVRDGSLKINLLICSLTVFITFGKEVREIIEYAAHLPAGTIGTPVFDISTLDLMFLSFYLIAITVSAKRLGHIIAAFILSGLYAFFCGKLASAWIMTGTARFVLISSIVISALIALIWSAKPRLVMKRHICFKRPAILICIACFIGIPLLSAAVFTALGLLTGGFDFLGSAALSSVTSFGGGEAYVAIAEAAFVQHEYVTSEVFFGRIVPVANALPGPILIKIAAAVGFIYGHDTSGSMAVGFIFSALTVLVCVGACSVIAIIVHNYYYAMENSAFIQSLKTFILPVICGSLISVMLTMLYQAMKVSAESGISPSLILTALPLCVAFVHLLHHRLKLRDSILLLGLTGVSLGVFYVTKWL